MSIKKGFTLVEVIIAIIISIIAIFGIETLIVESIKDWNASKEIVDLQRDLDVASYKIKGILEEANAYTVHAVHTFPAGVVLGPGQPGTDIIASNTGWSREFYLASGKIYDNYPPTAAGEIINTCSFLEFTNVDTQTVRVRVDVPVPNSTNSLSNIFLVYLRNKGGG